MKLTLQLFALALVPSLVSGAIFPLDSHVKMLDPKSFKKALKTNVSRRVGLSREIGVSDSQIENELGCFCSALVWCEYINSNSSLLSKLET